MNDLDSYHRREQDIFEQHTVQALDKLSRAVGTARRSTCSVVDGKRKQLVAKAVTIKLMSVVKV